MLMSTKAEKIAARSAASKRGWQCRKDEATATLTKVKAPNPWLKDMLVMLPSDRLDEIREHAEAIVKLIPKRRKVIGAKVLARVARRKSKPC
jgi:hypothetical protein